MKTCYHLFFETLGTELKLDLVVALRDKECSVTEISSMLKQERSKVSHALISLLECNIVQARKEGKVRIYSLNRKTMVPLLKVVEKHVRECCKTCRKRGKKT